MSPSEPSRASVTTQPRKGATLGPDIAQLTGIRSSKPTYYVEYRHTVESLHRALRLLDGTAQVLTATGDGPGALCREILVAAQEHLGAQWTVLALADGAVPEAAPRLVARGPGGTDVPTLLGAPDSVRRGVTQMLDSSARTPRVQTDGSVVVPMVIDGAVIGGLVATFDSSTAVEAADLAILRILTNQAAIALHSDHLLARSEGLRRRTEELYAEAEQRAATLAERHRQLDEVRAQLDDAAQREVIDAERHRIARELHDSVAQHVLSAGMTIEWCRPEVEHHTEVYERLQHAKELTRQAVDQLRGSIHALSHDQDGDDRSLPGRLMQLPEATPPGDLSVQVRVEGRPRALPAEVERSLLRIASECVFNVEAHAHARRAVVRLAYRPHEVVLTVTDDGCGDPEVLRRLLRHRPRLDGYHRGLGNILARAEEMGATLRITRARLGGIRVEIRRADKADKDQDAG